MGWHVLEDRWALLGATQGGLALERVASLFGGGREAVSKLELAATTATPGLVAVSVDEIARVTFRDIGDGVGPGHLWLGALKAITDQIQDVDQAMTRVVGPYHRIVAAGGWSRSPHLMRLKQDVFGDVLRSEVEETGARGAALLAGVAAGIHTTAGREFTSPPAPTNN